MRTRTAMIVSTVLVAGLTKAKHKSSSSMNH